MLDSVYHMTFEFIKIHFGMKKSRICYLFRNGIIDVITLCYQICKPLVVYRLYCMALYYSQRPGHVIKYIFEMITHDSSIYTMNHTDITSKKLWESPLN